MFHEASASASASASATAYLARYYFTSDITIVVLFYGNGRCAAERCRDSGDMVDADDGCC